MLGIPFTVWGIACLVVAAIWVFVWPNNKRVGANSLPRFILRWGHALVWLCLAAAAFIAGFDILGGTNTAQFVALLAALTYLVFMMTLVVTR
ncbi:MAG: hypothetical protein MUC51_11945 [Anaerolineae bacterium]|jgi:hypothetical protein|nr:hypothetical protein [Anaerolineae bacterium]